MGPPGRYPSNTTTPAIVHRAVSTPARSRSPNIRTLIAQVYARSDAGQPGRSPTAKSRREVRAPDPARTAVAAQVPGRSGRPGYRKCSAPDRTVTRIKAFLQLHPSASAAFSLLRRRGQSHEAAPTSSRRRFGFPGETGLRLQVQE